MINAQIVADSLSPQGDRLISVLATFPRIILAEVNTHRMLSKNTASSRAIPFERMVKAILDNPFIPIAWQKEHKGMQGSEYWTDERIQINDEEPHTLVTDYLVHNHLLARDYAITQAKIQTSIGATKQICNRYLEPFMWTTMLITGSKEGWDNFFELRCPQYHLNGKIYKSQKEAISEDDNDSFTENIGAYFRAINKGMAEIHIMDLAEKIYDTFNESTPKQLQSGEWHVPFQDKIDADKLLQTYIPTGSYNPEETSSEQEKEYYSVLHENLIKISTALAARTSYTVVGDEKEIDYKKMIELHDRLVNQKPLHASPMEHCARAMDDEEYSSYIRGFHPNDIIPTNDGQQYGWCRNYKGFIQYRHILETQNQI